MDIREALAFAKQCAQFATEYPDFEIVASLIRQLTWTHFIALFPIREPLKRSFYEQMAITEHWSTRTLRDKIASQLYERTAISRQPEETISDLGKIRHLVLDEGIEDLDCFSIGGGNDLISISFPSSLKNFGSHGNLCLGAGCTHLQQVFIASPYPEQLMSFKLDKSTDRAHTIKFCWTILAPMLHEPDARTQYTWYVPKSAYDRYKAHPLWGQLRIDTYSIKEGVSDVYWMDEKSYHYVKFSEE